MPRKHKTTEKTKAYDKAYNAAHREQSKAYSKAYRELHKDDIKAYNQNHKKEKKAHAKAHRLANIETIRARDSVYYQKNKATILAKQKLTREIKALEKKIRVLETQIENLERENDTNVVSRPTQQRRESIDASSTNANNELNIGLPLTEEMQLAESNLPMPLAAGTTENILIPPGSSTESTNSETFTADVAAINDRNLYENNNFYRNSLLSSQFLFTSNSQNESSAGQMMNQSNEVDPHFPELFPHVDDFLGWKL